eukprot:TRINITY_DN535_c0_g1_i1.p1 TRINITY_DN535_c0_g1~~TRINITY_DN535_c0_g1_i1.p1  ORF type:complete len:325 (-),score=91.37 TRINITY_DN535_c0_g1_i1:510-1484(-)
MLNGSGYEQIEQSMSHLSLGAEGAQSGQTEEPQASFAQQTNAPQEDPMSRYRVFVGGISWKATEQDLGQFFSQFGNVIDCKIIFDKVTHKSKGYGFITFDNEESVQKVLQAKQQNAAQLAIFGKAMDVGHAVRRNSPIEDGSAPKQGFQPPAQRGGYGGYGGQQRGPYGGGAPGRFPPGGGYPQQNFRGGRGGRFQPSGQFIDQAYGRQGSYGYGQQPYPVDPNQQWAGGYGKGGVAARQQQQFRTQQMQQQYWQGQVAAQAQRSYPPPVPGQYDAANASPYYGGVPQGSEDPSAAAAVPGFGGNFGIGQNPAAYPAFAYGGDV